MTTSVQHPNRNLTLIFRSATAALAKAIALALVVVLTQPAQAQTYNVLHTFYRSSDSGFPYAGLTMDKAGNLYGTAYATFICGSGECWGEVFKMSNKGSGWTFSPLYAFAG